MTDGEQRNCSNRSSFADSKPRQRQRQQEQQEQQQQQEEEQQQQQPVRIFKQLVRLVHPTQHPPAPPAPPPPLAFCRNGNPTGGGPLMCGVVC